MKINGNIQVEITFNQLIESLKEQSNKILENTLPNRNHMKITSVDIIDDEVFISYREIYDYQNWLLTKVKKQKVNFSNAKEKNLFICMKNLIKSYEQ